MLILFALTVMVIGFMISLKRPDITVLLTIFFVSWGGLEIDIGLRLTVYQLLLLPLVLVTVVRAAYPGWEPPALPARMLLGLLVLQAILWSLLQLGFLPVLAVGDGALRGPTPRAIIQIFMFLFTMSPVVVIACWLKGAEGAAQAYRVYLASLVVLAALGWFQIILKYTINVDPYPIGALNVALGGSSTIPIREGLFSFEAFNIYRMNSFAGEPRNLGVALAIGMLSLQVLALVAPRRPGWRLVALYLFLWLTELATFSTSGLGVWAGGTVATVPALLVTRTPIARRASSLVKIGLAFAGVIVVAIVGLELNGIPILNLLGERTVDRIARDGAVEDFDLAIIDYFRTDPGVMLTGLGLGNAHLYAMPYLDPLFGLYAEGRIFVGKSGIIRTISETGFIGLTLLLTWFLRLMLLAAAKRDRLVPGAAVIAFMPMVAFMLSSLFQSEMYIAAGLLSVIIIGARTLPATNPAATPA